MKDVHRRFISKKEFYAFMNLRFTKKYENVK